MFVLYRSGYDESHLHMYFKLGSQNTRAIQNQIQHTLNVTHEIYVITVPLIYNFNFTRVYI